MIAERLTRGSPAGRIRPHDRRPEMRGIDSLRSSFLSALVAACLAVPAAADDTAAANRLFVAAVQAWTAAEEMTGDDLQAAETRLALLRETSDNLRRIVEAHSGADLAVRLVIGEAVGPLSLPGVEAALAAAESDRCFAAPTRDCVLAAALAMAREIEGAFGRAWALGEIAAATGSAELFDEAITIAREIRDASERASALGEIAAAMGSAELFHEVIATAREIRDASRRARALREIAAAKDSAELFGEAIATAREIRHKSRRARALSEIAAAQANVSRFDEALAAAREIEEASLRAWPLSEIAAAQAKAGLFAEAISTAREIEEASWRASVVAAITRHVPR